MCLNCQPRLDVGRLISGHESARLHEIWCGIHLVYVCALTLAMSEETPKEVVKQEEEKPASEPQQQASEDKTAEQQQASEDKTAEQQQASEDKPAEQQQASEDKPAAPEGATAAEKPEEVNGSNSGLFAYAAHISSSPVTLVLLYCL